MRILVTASRDWNDYITIKRKLLEHAKGNRNVTVIHGDCPTGGDRIADAVATELGWAVEKYPADWQQHGKSAGPIRNVLMVRKGAHVCVAFIKGQSRGATGCADLAEKAGIPTDRVKG